MALYRTAGLWLEFEPKYERLRSYAEKYLYSGLEKPSEIMDLNIPVGFLEKMQKEHSYLSMEACEYIWTGALFAYKLLDKNGFVIHSSAIAYNGYAYLFSADSGTGKSTHTKFWQDVFGKDKAVIINDDKPALRETDGIFYASGTMFSGKSPMSENISVPVKALCFIYRSEKNEIKRLDPGDALPLLLGQTFRPKEINKISNFMSVLDSFLRKVPVYSLGVTYSPESAKFAYNAINEDSFC